MLEAFCMSRTFPACHKKKKKKVPFHRNKIHPDVHSSLHGCSYGRYTHHNLFLGVLVFEYSNESVYRDSKELRREEDQMLEEDWFVLVDHRPRMVVYKNRSRILNRW